VSKKALRGYTEGRRPVGRPRERWLNAVDRESWQWRMKEAM
jgi:hypothetical protein